MSKSENGASAYLAHNCTVLQKDKWICEDCGKDFPRDPLLGDYPEEAIIEGECETILDLDEWNALQRWGLGNELGGEA